MSSHYEERIRTDKKLPTLKTAVPEGLKMILQNACEYEPSLRYQNAEAFKSDLCQLKKIPTISLGPPETPINPGILCHSLLDQIFLGHHAVSTAEQVVFTISRGQVAFFSQKLYGMLENSGTKKAVRLEAGLRN